MKVNSSPGTAIDVGDATHAPQFAIVKNWSRLQHYKNRTPPWIKLHRTLLDDYEYQCLPLASKALAPMIWLLASDGNDGKVRIDLEFLEFRLRWSREDLQFGISGLIRNGFLVGASNVLAECLHDATLEAEAETEAELATSNDVACPQPKLPDCPHQKLIALYAQHLPHLRQPRSWDGARKQNLRARWLQAARPSQYSPGYGTEADGLEFWSSFFEHLAGTRLARGFARDGRTWLPDLPWIAKAANFQKIVDGNYDQ